MKYKIGDITEVDKHFLFVGNIIKEFKFRYYNTLTGKEQATTQDKKLKDLIAKVNSNHIIQSKKGS